VRSPGKRRRGGPPAGRLRPTPPQPGAARGRKQRRSPARGWRARRGAGHAASGHEPSRRRRETLERPPQGTTNTPTQKCTENQTSSGYTAAKRAARRPAPGRRRAGRQAEDRNEHRAHRWTTFTAVRPQERRHVPMKYGQRGMKDEAVGEGREGDLRRRQYLGADDPHPLVGHRTRGRLEEEESRTKPSARTERRRSDRLKARGRSLSRRRHDSTGLLPDVWSGFDPSFIMGFDPEAPHLAILTLARGPPAARPKAGPSIVTARRPRGGPVAGLDLEAVLPTWALPCAQAKGPLPHPSCGSAQPPALRVDVPKARVCASGARGRASGSSPASSSW
jgi:hypothetical protein